MLRLRAGLPVLAALLVAAACGSDSSTGNGVTGLQDVATVALNATGPSPQFIQILAGGRLTFANRDAAARQITSTDCADILTHRLEAGADETIEVHDGPRTCTYADALGATWQGHLSIVAHPRDGGSGGQ